MNCTNMISLISLVYMHEFKDHISKTCLSVIYILHKRVGRSTTKLASLRTSNMPSIVSPCCSKHERKQYNRNYHRVHMRGTNKGQAAKDSYQCLWSRNTKAQISSFWRSPFSHQKATIKHEIRVLEGLCNTNIRDGSAQESYENITPLIFQNFTQAVQERCPLIHEVIEALVISNQQERNVHKTNSHKMLCGLQTLAFMVNIRNSNARNCFPLMFGLLCISYGAGKQFVDMLQSMGLSLHWNTMWVLYYYIQLLFSIFVCFVYNIITITRISG